jgi:hypothetical protein
MCYKLVGDGVPSADTRNRQQGMKRDRVVLLVGMLGGLALFLVVARPRSRPPATAASEREAAIREPQYRDPTLLEGDAVANARVTLSTGQTTANTDRRGSGTTF